MRYPWYFKPFYPAILHDVRARHVSEFVRSIQPGDFVNEDLKRLTTRVSIVWGTADRLFAMKSVEIMKEAIPRAQVNLMDNCGHVPQLEKPREFTGIIRNILRGETS
jgi:pimeloyl-ACP methyl ester carboxylesterase